MYHIGLPIIAERLHVIVQLNSFSAVGTRFIDMKVLNSALNNDPYLSPIPPMSKAAVMQALFVGTVCDYFFLCWLGKGYLLEHFLQILLFYMLRLRTGTRYTVYS